MIKKIDYKFIGVIEAEKIKVQKMKETFQKKKIRRACLVLQVKLSSHHKIKAIDTYDVSAIRSGRCIIALKKAKYKN